MQIIQSYNARYIIGDHFDNLINEIDKRTETFILKSTDQDEIDSVNSSRAELIRKIESLKEECLSNNVDIQEEFEQSWDLLIDDKRIKYETKLDLFKRDLLKLDCLVVDDATFKIGCSLWITPWFNTKRKIDFLRFLIYF